MKHRRAFLLTDMLTGLVICGALLAAIGVTTTRWKRASDRLAHDRAAVEAARQTLMHLQQRMPRPQVPEARIDIRPLSGNWVEVHAHVQEREAILVGLLPEGVYP